MVSDQSTTRHLSWKATRSLPPSSTHFLGVEGCHLRGWRNPKIVWLPLIKIKNDPCLMIGVTLKTRRYVILGFRGFSRRVWGSGLGTKRGRYIHCLWSGANHSMVQINWRPNPVTQSSQFTIQITQERLVTPLEAAVWSQKRMRGAKEWRFRFAVLTKICSCDTEAMNLFGCSR